MSDERKQQIIDAARQLYEEQGLSRTSVKDISERCGVARSLFYHYFPDKQAVTSAVIDDFIADYIELLQFWNDQRTPGNIEEALDGVVRVLRVGVFENSNFRQAIDTRENAALNLEFLNRVADRTATYFMETTVRDYAQAHPVKIDHVYETFYVLIMGICMYIRTHRDVSNEVLKDIIAQTLHMQRGDENGAGCLRASSAATKDRPASQAAGAQAKPPRRTAGGSGNGEAQAKARPHPTTAALMGQA